MANSIIGLSVGSFGFGRPAAQLAPWLITEKNAASGGCAGRGDHRTDGHLPAIGDGRGAGGSTLLEQWGPGCATSMENPPWRVLEH